MLGLLSHAFTNRGERRSYATARKDPSRRLCNNPEQDELQSILTWGTFPPISAPIRENVLIQRKLNADEVGEKLLAEWGKRSFVARTVIDYPLDESPLSSDGDSYTSLQIRSGYSADGRVVLLPPEFTVLLVREASSCDLPDPTSHWFSFDYSPTTGEPFYCGLRIITIPSLLFPITARAHYSKIGPPALSMLVHDVNYHIMLEGNIPQKHREIFIALAKLFNFNRSSSDLIRNPNKKELKDLSQKFARYLADRELVEYYRSRDSVEAFWGSLQYWIGRVLRDLNQETGEWETSPFGEEWASNVLTPVLCDFFVDNHIDDLFKLDLKTVESKIYQAIETNFKVRTAFPPLEFILESSRLVCTFKNGMKISCHVNEERLLDMDFEITFKGVAYPFIKSIETECMTRAFCEIFSCLPSIEGARAGYFYREFIELLCEIFTDSFVFANTAEYEIFFRKIEEKKINIERVVFVAPLVKEFLIGGSIKSALSRFQDFASPLNL